MNHTREIADARYWADHGRYIEQAGERRAAQVAAMPRTQLIRGETEMTRLQAEMAKIEALDAVIAMAPDEPRPHWLRRMVWPGVAFCAVALLALMGVR